MVCDRVNLIVKKRGMLLMCCVAASLPCALPGNLVAQEEPANGPSVLQAYIDEALEANLALRQQVFVREQSVQALREARGLFFPTLDLEARYTRADGGRQIEFPAGDLLNPVYTTLNDLLTAQGQQPSFPTVENVRIPFFRTREQDTRLRVTQPVFDLGIHHKYRAQRHLVSAEEAIVEARRSALIRDVKLAYFDYLRSEQAVEILAATVELAQEGLRTNQSLAANERVTADAVFRAQADVLEVDQQYAEGVKERNLARSYFNFLLNRALEAPIELDPSIDSFIEETDASIRVPPRTARITLPPDTAGGPPGAVPMDLEAERAGALERRAELRELDAALRASESAVSAAKSAFVPGLYVAVDAGIQERDYTLTGDAPFYLASVVVRWNLFRGLRDRARVGRARLEVRRLEAQREEIARRIELEVQTAMDAVLVAERSLLAATGRAEAAREGFRLTSRRYEEGLGSQIDFLDARTTLTNAELNLNIVRYDLLKRLAELEYATGRSQAEERVR